MAYTHQNNLLRFLIGCPPNRHRQLETPELVFGSVFEEEGVNVFVSAMKALPPGSAAVIDFCGHFASVLKV